MAGNRTIYEQAINEGNSAAWEQRWDQAIASYARALDEFPDDSSVMSSMGLALLAKQRYEQALVVYQRAAQLNPEDPLPIEKCAEILEAMNKMKEAAQAYYLAAEAFVAKRDVNKAIEDWSRSTQLNPDHLLSNSRLALAYERIGKNTEASNAYVSVARILQKDGHLQKALQTAQRAAQVDQRNAAAMQAIDLIQHGGSLPEPPRPRPGTGMLRMPPSEAFAPLDSFLPRDTGSRPLPGKKFNPLEDARGLALSHLANLLFDMEDAQPEDANKGGRPGILKRGSTDPFKNVRGNTKTQVLSLLSQGIDLQSKGSSKTALAFFDKALRGGMEHAALNLMIGAAHFDDKRYKEAVKQLQAAARHPEYAAGAAYGIGLAYGREEKMKEAVGHLLRSLQYVDQQTVPASQAEPLAALYETFEESLGGQSAEQLIQIGESLVAFLSGSGWKDRVKQARQQLDAQQEDGALVPLAEMISIPGADRVFESMALIERFISKKRLASALDECHHAIRYSPSYLPVHMKMGEILAMEGRAEAAFEKFAVAAELYQIRGEAGRALKIYQQMAQIAPADLTIRARLIDMLTAQGNLLEAIRHTVDVADVHISLADFDSARQSLNSALLLAQKPGLDKRVAVQILHKIGEIDMQRDWRQAVRTYEQIRTQNPSDEKARLALIGLYFRLGNARHALVEVDDMLKHFVSIDGLPKPTQLLETLVNEYGGDVNLRQRLARLYQQAGRREETIVQLDEIAVLYHQSGNRAETIRTIQAIIALGPENVSEYQQLLQQIQSSA